MVCAGSTLAYANSHAGVADTSSRAYSHARPAHTNADPSRHGYADNGADACPVYACAPYISTAYAGPGDCVAHGYSTHGNSYPYAAANAHTFASAHTDSHTTPGAHSHACARADAYAYARATHRYPKANADTLSNPCAFAHIHPFAHIHALPHSHTYTHTNSYAHAGPHAKADSLASANTHDDANTCAHAYPRARNRPHRLQFFSGRQLRGLRNECRRYWPGPPHQQSSGRQHA